MDNAQCRGLQKKNKNTQALDQRRASLTKYAKSTGAFNKDAMPTIQIGEIYIQNISLNFTNVSNGQGQEETAYGLGKTKDAGKAAIDTLARKP